MDLWVSSRGSKVAAPPGVRYSGLDVPFEPNDQWVRLTPTLEIQLPQASCTASSFQYRLETRPQSQDSRPLKPGDPLSSRLVVARQLIRPDGKPRDRPFGPSPWVPAPVGGGMSGSGPDCQIKTLRLVIAVENAICQLGSSGRIVQSYERRDSLQVFNGCLRPDYLESHSFRLSFTCS